MVLHLVQVVRLQVVHQDGEASHDFGLLSDSGLACCASAAPCDIHFSADPVNFLEIEFDAATVGPFARAHAQGLVAEGLLLLYSDQALLLCVHVDVPSIIDLLKTTFFQCVLFLAWLLHSSR